MVICDKQNYAQYGCDYFTVTLCAIYTSVKASYILITFCCRVDTDYRSSCYALFTLADFVGDNIWPKYRYDKMFSPLWLFVRLCRWHVSRHKIVDDKENNFCLVGWSNFVAERRQLEQCVSRKRCKISLRPRPGDIKRWCCLPSDVCLSDVCRISGRRAACPADRLDGAYWLIGPGSAGLAQGCRCALPLQSWAGAYRGGRPHTTY